MVEESGKGKRRRNEPVMGAYSYSSIQLEKHGRCFYDGDQVINTELKYCSNLDSC